MSRKTKVAGASSSKVSKKREQDAPTTLVPELRFPEFQGDEEWQSRHLGEFVNEHKRKSDRKSEVHSVSVHKGVINQKEHLGRSFAAKDTSNYNLAQPNDVIYTKSPTGDFPYGIVKQSRIKKNVIVSPLYGVFTPVTPALGLIIDCFFEAPRRAYHYLDPITQKGAKNTIQITNQGFLSGKVTFPHNPSEQQKIADCLGSLDDLIAAHSRKLDALQDHKKGLLQQLFPAEGETTPKRRFPGFEGEWDSRKLSDICKIQRGKFSHRPRNYPKFFGGEYPFIQTGDVVKSRGGSVKASQTLNEEGLKVSRLFIPTLVLITIAANIGDTGLLTMPGCFTDSVVGLTPDSQTDARFLELAVRGKKQTLNNIAAQAAQKNINNEILADLDLLIPKLAEQKKSPTASAPSTTSSPPRPSKSPPSKCTRRV